MDYLTTAAMATPMLLAIGGVVCFVYAQFVKGKRRSLVGILSASFLLAAFALLLAVAARGFEIGAESAFAVLRPNSLGILIGLLATGLGATACLYSQGTLDSNGPINHFYPLLLFALAGTVAIGFAEDLFTMFVMVELSALPSYALVAYNFKRNRTAVAAAIKYLLQGAAGTLTAILGVSFLYLTTGTLRVNELQTAFVNDSSPLFALSAILVIVGYGVKIALVPMHTWLPDAYCHAPTGVTAIMAGATKAGALVALFRAIAALPYSPLDSSHTGLIVSIFAILTMTVGNFLALGQRNLKRMLAYSSVAQMGYVLLGFGVGLQYSVEIGLAAGLFYLVVYGIMKGGAFLCAGAFGRATNGGSTLEELRGVGARNPVIGVSFSLFILGLIGLPATAGFPGKLMLLQAGLSPLNNGTWLNWGTFLVVCLALNSALSLGYYVPALSNILFKQGHSPTPTGRIPIVVTAAIVPLAVTTVVLGLYPQIITNLTDPASVLFRPGGWI